MISQFRVLAELNRDPTRTLTIRSRYMSEFGRRFRRAKGLVRTSIQSNDALDVGARRPIRFLEADPAGKKIWAGLTDEQKATAFATWFRTVIDEELLEVLAREGATVTQHRQWQRPYVSGAYTRGIAQALAFVRAVGVAEASDLTVERILRSPFHRDRIQTLLARNFTELQGITEATAQRLTRIIADGLSEGLGPPAIARRLTREIDSIGLARARVLAQTEVVRSHAEATLNLYERLEVPTVEAQAEFSTAGDDLVCPQCEDLEGKIFTVKEARGIIPVHPRCRCTWLPVVGSKRVQNFRALLAAA